MAGTCSAVYLRTSSASMEVIMSFHVCSSSRSFFSASSSWRNASVCLARSPAPAPAALSCLISACDASGAVVVAAAGGREEAVREQGHTADTLACCSGAL